MNPYVDAVVAGITVGFSVTIIVWFASWGITKIIRFFADLITR
jgi:hypothetical protein